VFSVAKSERCSNSAMTAQSVEGAEDTEERSRRRHQSALDELGRPGLIWLVVLVEDVGRWLGRPAALLVFAGDRTSRVRCGGGLPADRFACGRLMSFIAGQVRLCGAGARRAPRTSRTEGWTQGDDSSRRRGITRPVGCWIRARRWPARKLTNTKPAVDGSGDDRSVHTASGIGHAVPTWTTCVDPGEWGGWLSPAFWAR